MAGIYFIAAGDSSDNRTKSLDRMLDAAGVREHLESEAQELFEKNFKDNEGIYAWGADRRGDLDKLSPGDYVVDVKNKEVVQVFRYGFVIDTPDTRLRDWIGWDSEKPEKRPFRFVYFLSAPQETTHRHTSYFQSAFAKEKNPQWLIRQTWFSDDEILSAMERTKTLSLEGLLGIADSKTPTVPPGAVDAPGPYASPKPAPQLRPGWLLPVIEQIESLHADQNHLERDHEDVVAHLFERLGYSRGQEIKFQRDRVDILIIEGGDVRPKAVVEVKRDWTLSRKSMNYIRQAHSYALETGVRWVVLTNGDRYIVYDRLKGLSYDDQFECEFELTSLSPQGLRCLTNLSKDSLR